MAASTVGQRALRDRLEELLDELREALQGCLDGMTEQEAKERLVPSRTTLLSLVKHVTFVEAFWFCHAVDGRSLSELGVASTVGRSWSVRKADTVDSVRREHERVVREARTSVASLDLFDEVHGNGTSTVWQLHVQVLRELAQHAGHADVLREQLLARR